MILGFSSSSSFHFLFSSVGIFVVVHEQHEQHDVVIVMFSGRPSLIYSLAGLSRAAWDTEEDQALIEIFRLDLYEYICWIVKIVLINLYAIIIMNPIPANDSLYLLLHIIIRKKFQLVDKKLRGDLNFEEIVYMFFTRPLFDG